MLGEKGINVQSSGTRHLHHRNLIDVSHAEVLYVSAMMDVSLLRTGVIVQLLISPFDSKLT